MIRPAMSCLGAITLAVISVAIARADEEPVGYTGAIVATADENVSLRITDGTVKTVNMMRGWYVATMRPVPVETIEAGSFIGSANTPVDENTGRAVELRIFEPGSKPEQGTHAMKGRATLMTHGTVTNVTVTNAGREVNVEYPGGARRIIVSAEIQVRQGVVVDQARARPGAVVTAVTRKGPDGVWRATRLLISDNGPDVPPPTQQ